MVEVLRQVRSSSPVSVRLAGSSLRSDRVVGVARRARAGRWAACRCVARGLRRGSRRLHGCAAWRCAGAGQRENSQAAGHAADGDYSPEHGEIVSGDGSTLKVRRRYEAEGIIAGRTHSFFRSMLMASEQDPSGFFTSVWARSVRASCGRLRQRKGFKIVGAVDIDPAKVGRDLGEVAGLGRTLRVKVSDDAQEGHQGDEAGRRRAVHELVAEEGAAADRRRSSSCKVPIVSTTEELAYPTKGNMRYARAIQQLAKKAKVAVLGTGVNPGLRHGCAADHADRRLRARRSDAHRSHPGRAHPPAAVPAEDRRRPDARAVPAQGRRGQRAPRRAGRVGVDDRGRAGLEAR